MSIEEALRNAKTPLAATLEAGVDAISYDQTVTFKLYVRVILPIDGFAFWVRADLVSEGALYNSLLFNDRATALYAKAPSSTARDLPPFKIEAEGSLHYATQTTQEQEANDARNRVVFTSEEPIVDLNEVGDNLIYIAEFDVPQEFDEAEPRGRTRIRFAFSQRESYYVQAGLHHYVGASVVPTMASQIVDSPLQLIGAARQQIVSNSLPFWLMFNNYDPAWPVPPRPAIPLYPSFLVPDNLRPPYGVVHVPPTSTQPVQSQPYYGRTFSQSMLVSENVEMTIYGANNIAVLDLITALVQYSFDNPSYFGITNSPIPQDEKEGQSEFNTLAQKKRITFALSYNQYAARRVVRQLILHCFPTFIVGDYSTVLNDIIGA